MESEWSSIDSAGVEDVHVCLRRVRVTLVGCKSLHHALVARQALALAETTQPLRERLEEVSSTAPDVPTDALNARVGVAELFTSVDSIEDEYRRLAAEQEVLRTA